MRINPDRLQQGSAISSTVDTEQSYQRFLQPHTETAGAVGESLRHASLPDYGADRSVPRGSGSSSPGSRFVWLQRSGSLTGHHPEHRPQGPHHRVTKTERQSRGPRADVAKHRSGKQHSQDRKLCCYYCYSSVTASH